MSEPASNDSTPATKRRWPGRLLVGLTLLLIAAAVLGPAFGARFLRARIEAAAAESLEGKLTIEDVSVSLNGKVELREVVIDDTSGAQVARIERAFADVGLRSLMTGKKDITVRVEGVQVEAVRGDDGTWNLAELIKGGAPAGSPDAETRAPGGTGDGGLPEAPLDLEGRIEVSDLTLTLRGGGTVLEWRDAFLRVGLDGDQRDVSLEGGARLAGGDGSAGDLKLEGALWPELRSGVRVDELALTGFELGAGLELAKILGVALEPGTRAGGEVDLTLAGRTGDFALEAPWRFTARGAGRAIDIHLPSADGEPTDYVDAAPSLDLVAELPEGAGAPRARGEVSAKDGRLAATAVWDGAAARGLQIDVDVDGLGASAGLEPYLRRVHPAFAGAAAFDGAKLDALVSSDLTIAYGAPLTLDALAGGWEALDKEPFAGTGSLSVASALLESSPFVAQMLEAFGRPANATFDLAPLRFGVDAGRIRYLDPWTWTLQGTETTFTGSVGLDRGLDLAWNVPVTGGLARQNRVFEAIEGQVFTVRVGGTLTSPSFGITEALSEVAQNALRSRLEEEASEAKRDLDAKIEKEIEKVLPGGLEGGLERVIGIGGGDDPAALLKQADELWGKGQRADAAKIYRRIRKDFPLSPVYLLNKKRIKSRRNG